MKPEAHALAPNVTLVVGLTPVLEFRQSGEQGRVARRFGDVLLAAAGGRAVIPEELAGVETPALPAAVRALGGDPAYALTFRIVVSRTPRTEVTPSPLRGLRSSVFVMLDYTVRLEVGRPGSEEVIGTVETVAGASPTDPEIGDDGESLGMQSAIDEAVTEAVARFAPSLRSDEPGPRLMEVPADPSRRTLSTGERLDLLAMLYPEHPAETLHRLAASGAAFLVLSAGALQRVGIAAGDVLGPSRGAVLGSRAALARKLAAGTIPAMYAERGSDRFLISETNLASAAAGP